jgi:hypothetical protein
MEPTTAGDIFRLKAEATTAGDIFCLKAEATAIQRESPLPAARFCNCGFRL